MSVPKVDLIMSFGSRARINPRSCDARELHRRILGKCIQILKLACFGQIEALS
jgi:hypothetical protein